MRSSNEWRQSRLITIIALVGAFILLIATLFTGDHTDLLQWLAIGFVGVGLFQNVKQQKMTDIEKSEVIPSIPEGQSKRVINVSEDKRIIYGYDSQDEDNPYFLKIVNPVTGKTTYRNSSIDVTKEELLAFLEEEFPLPEEGKSDIFAFERQIIEEDKLKIAAGLPF